MKRSVSAILLLCLSATAFVGCQLTPSFTTGYRVDSVRLLDVPLQDSLAVKRFEDQRAPRRYTTAGKLFLTYIPLIPYVSLPFERLEESVRMQSDNIRAGGRGMTWGARQKVAPDFETYAYPTSFAQAVAEDLGASGLFSEVVYVGDREPDGQRYVLNGAVRATPFKTTATSYMLGMPGVLLWILPIPMAKVSAQTQIDLTLTDSTTNAVVWKRSLQSKVSRLVTLYTSSAMVYGQAGAFSLNIIPPPSKSKVDRRSLFSWHFEALRRAMAEAKPDLAKALKSRK
ncbi:hypothetical protein JW916_05310 [Candidatus Sumerlaeota bacterium]|nr:hypothetical protein [Candidatus Sumerlaeota bacterium]